MTAPLVPDFKTEVIQGATGPCKAYSGVVAAIKTFNGTPVILMAATRSALLDAIKEINPSTRVDAQLFMGASLIHEQHIQREDDEI